MQHQVCMEEIEGSARGCARSCRLTRRRPGGPIPTRARGFTVTAAAPRPGQRPHTQAAGAERPSRAHERICGPRGVLGGARTVTTPRPSLSGKSETRSAPRERPAVTDSPGTHRTRSSRPRGRRLGFPGPEQELKDELATFESFFKTFGFKRIHGRVWGLLVLAGQPLSAKEVVAELGISQGVASTTINELVEWGAVTSTFDPARRCNVHEAVGNTLSIVATVLRRREQVAFDHFKTGATRMLEIIRERHGQKDPRVPHPPLDHRHLRSRRRGDEARLHERQQRPGRPPEPALQGDRDRAQGGRRRARSRSPGLDPARPPPRTAAGCGRRPPWLNAPRFRASS